LVFWQAGTVAGFDELVTEALTAPFSGWDFSWLDRRSWTEPLPWDYSARVAALARNARTMLDLGTGGGEAVVFYLKAVSWSIPGYSLENYRDRLRALYEDASAWPVVTSGHRFLLVASKPG
jgi:hypothetical protein